MMISGRLFDDLRFASVAVAGGKITRCEPEDRAAEFDTPIEILAPGFIDLQVNGWGGIAFNDPRLTTQQVESVTHRLWQTGVAHYCPTLITDSFENLSRGMAAIARARREGAAGRAILGIHLEGPYLSPEDGPRGAHPLEHVRPPDWDEFRRLQDAADGLICLVTLAPEREGAIPFIEKLVAADVRVAIGHTAATSADIRAAIAAGASMSTHLGNAAHDRLQRHHNYVYDQLAADELWASLIVDGHHLPPGLVKIFVRAKRPERTILVSDAMHWAGMPPGIYPFGPIEVEVRDDGWIGVVGQPRLAGSGLLLYRGLENVVRFAGVSLATAVNMVTRHAAELLGRYPQLGSLQPGGDATLTVFDWDTAAGKLTVRRTIVVGETVFERDS
jgi:N-acetylglucosamine-6-phosphate deacetylase